MNQDISFGQLVREYRLSLGLTQAELSIRVGCATITIRKIEANDLRPSTQIAELLAAALGIPEADQSNFVRLGRTARLNTPSPSPVPPLPPLPEEIGGRDLSGSAIRGYQLGERIGVGSYGVVYRAAQPVLNREVAVKIILPAYANRPDFIRCFEAEAQTVARLEHPYIVPLYNFWREPGAAYLVMRLMRGGSLASRLQKGALSPTSVAHILAQICPALHAAHRAGVVHRDIKPANILRDPDGNAYLADFGIARDQNEWAAADDTPFHIRLQEPAYVSPEQIRTQPVKPQADIYSLGALIFTLLTGQRPFPDQSKDDIIQAHLSQPLPPLAQFNPDLPPALNQVIQRATAKQPAARYPDVMSLLADMEQIVNDDSRPRPLKRAPPAGEIENPFKGLHAFGEMDTAVFFGRKTFVLEMLGRLAEATDLSRFLALVGPSGSGKSSVVKAGLIPALRRGGLPGSEKWFVVDFKPGTHPLSELATALQRVAVNPPDDLLNRLRQNKRGLHWAVNRLLPPDDPGVELALVIDQFEELFTLINEEAERAHFLASLVAAVLDPASRLRIIITLRADFTNKPLQYVDFGELMRRRAEFILPLTPDELAVAITGPAQRVGLQIEPDLVHRIVREVGDQPGALPLLQYALTELFERREGCHLTTAAYKASGGVLGALARRAEEIYVGLSASEQAVSRQLFLRLITLGEGAEDTRRRVKRLELIPSNQVPGSAIDPVLNAFSRYRLLTFDHDPVTREPTVEVAHEALIEEWGRLRDWLDESRADLYLQRALCNGANEWLAAGRDPGFFLRGSRLDQFDDWAQATDLALSANEQAYLRASLAERRQRQAAEAVRQEKERARERRALQRSLALHARQALRELDSGKALALTLAAAGMEEPPPEVMETLQEAAFAPGARRQFRVIDTAGQAAQIHTLAVSPNGETAAVGLAAGQIQLLNLATGAVRRFFTGQAVTVTKVIFSPDGAALLSGDFGGEMILWDTASGSEIRRFHGHTLSIHGLDFTPDGRCAVSAACAPADLWRPGELFLWDVADGRKIREFVGHPYGVSTAVFSPDGQTVLSGSRVPGGVGLCEFGVPLILWHVESGEIIHQLRGPNEMNLGAAIHPDGRAALTTAASKLYLWDLATGQSQRIFEGHGSTVLGVAITPNGYRALSGEDKGCLIFWNIKSGKPIARLTHPFLTSFALCPDGRTALSAALDGSLIVWDLISADEARRFEGHEGGIAAVAFTPDGKRILSSGGSDFRFNIPGEDNSLRLWEIETGEQLQVLRGHTEIVVGIAVSEDGRRALSVSSDKSLRLWNLETGTEIRRFEYPHYLWSAAFSPDGKRALTATSEPSILLWDLETGAILHYFIGHAGLVLTAAFSPDGKRLVSGGIDRSIILWDTAAGTEIRRFWQSDFVSNVLFSPDGRLLIAADIIGRVVVWDVEAGEIKRVLQANHALIDINMMAVGPDSRTIVASDWEGNVLVWDWATDTIRRRFSMREPLPAYSAISPDGCYILAGSQNQSIVLWEMITLSPEELRRWIAANRVARPLTPAERALYRLDPFAGETAVSESGVIRRSAVMTNCARGTAVSGKNRGEIGPNRWDTWLYHGQAGEQLTIRLTADHPANTMPPEERERLGLLDTMLMVMSPDGKLLAKNEDIRWGIVTDSLIEGLALPVTGNYRIEARSMAGAGEYTLTINSMSV